MRFAVEIHMSRLAAGVAVVLCILVCPPLLHAETVVGGEAEVSLRVGDGTPDVSVPNVPVDGKVRFRPQLAAFSDYWDLNVVLDLAVSNAAEELDAGIRELNLALYPTNWAEVRLGRFAFDPSSAFLFPATEGFYQVDTTAMFEGRLNDVRSGTNVLQLRILPPVGFIVATLAPAIAPADIPDLDSPWFPMDDILEQLTQVEFPGYTFSLEELDMADPEVPEMMLRNMNAAVHGSIYLAGVDVTAGWRRGMQPGGVFLATANFDTDPADPIFDLTLRPHYPISDSFFVTAGSALRQIELWADLAYSPNRQVQSNVATVQYADVVVGNPVARTETHQTQTFTATAGIRFTPFSLPLQAVIEGRWAWFHDEEDLELEVPLLQRVAAAYIRYEFLEGLFTPEVITVVSGADWSTALVPSLLVGRNENLQVRVSGPVFFGGENDELGQYKGNITGQASLTVKF